MGRFKLIESPDKLWKLFQEYKEDTKKDPIRVHDFVGKDGVSVYRERDRPLTMEGFENYVADIDEMPMDLGDYFANKGGAYDDFSTICSRIRRAIRQDQIEGGMAGIYNPSITQRLNGLTDKSETKIIQEQPLFPD
jgi:hypothetical protein